MKLSLPLFIILLAAFSQSVVGQVKRTMRFSSNKGMFCSQTIILDSTGLFFYQSGCEGHSNISFGKYKLGKNNKINFQFLPFDSINPINKIIQDLSAKETDSLITLTFYDRFNQPLGFNFGIRLGDTSNHVQEMWTDVNGQIKLQPFLFKYVSLVQFLTMYRETDGIELGQKSLKVYFNFPYQFLLYPELKLDLPRKLNLQLKQKGLYDVKSKQIVYTLD